VHAYTAEKVGEYAVRASGLLEGRNVNLRVVEKEDLPLLLEWNNDSEFGDEYEPLEQVPMLSLRSGIAVFVPMRISTAIKQYSHRFSF